MSFNIQRCLFVIGIVLCGRETDAKIIHDRLPIDLFPIVPANWSACPVLSDGTITVNNVYAQCMMVDVPIDWNETNATAIQTNTLQVFVKRFFLAGTQDTSHHLWRIPGGGGIPISTLEFEAISVVSVLNGSVSIYATDKRSVGHSSLLECPTSIITNFSACIPFIRQNQYRLKHNTYTNTARDLQYILRVVARQRSALPSPLFKPRVVIMGSSQGTYLLQRYLHVMEENEPVDAIILDSVLPSDITRLVNGDRYLNYVFLDLFTRCAQDYDSCAKHFEDNNPLRALYTYVINGDIGRDTSCLTLFNTSTVEIGKKMSFIFYPGTMDLLPALIYRINRCNVEDQKVLAHFIQQTQAPAEDGSSGFSILVELNNNLAELWSAFNSLHNETFSCDRLKGMSDNTFSATHVMPDIYCPIEATGILGYPTDQYYRKYPKNKPAFPVLLIHGDMDQALPVPISRHFYKEYSKVNSKLIYVELPRTGHTATNASPMPNRQDTCGWNVAMSFMLSPNFQPDTSCLKDISSIDFAGVQQTTKTLALHYFGTDDIWGTDC